MPPLDDLIELSSITSNTTYSYDDGTILGVIDGSTYDGDNENSKTAIRQLSHTSSEGGILTVQGVRYKITVSAPDGTNQHVTLTDGAGLTRKVTGSDDRSDVAFIKAVPASGQGPARYFAVFSDKVGDVDVRTLQTRRIDFDPSGNEVMISISRNNDVRVVCFTPGTLIETRGGPRPVEGIGAGDLVHTRDNGLQAVSWAGACHLSARDLARRAALRPIRIRAGALGCGIPARDLVVSPQHRILLRSSIALRMFGTQEILVPAKLLTAIEGVDVVTRPGGVTYHHLLFSRHEVITANGAETESLFIGPQALASVSDAARAEILGLFPMLADAGFAPPSARPLPLNREARQLLARHIKHHRPLVSGGRESITSGEGARPRAS